MIIRLFKKNAYQSFCNSLFKYAHAEPLSASYDITLHINKTEYIVKFQPEPHCKVAVLQALRVIRTDDGPEFELITKNNLLSAFTEIMIEQGVA